VAILTSVVSVAAGLIGIAPAGAVVLGEFCALACVGASTLPERVASGTKSGRKNWTAAP